MNHYDTLGVKPDATPEEIKAAKRKKASEHHPDKPGGDGQEMAKINRAYEVLADPQRRAQYDETGSDAPPASPNDKARELLLKMMADAIGSDVPNSIKAVHAMLRQQATAASDDQKASTKRTYALRKRRSKIISKSGENLAHTLIDMVLQQLEDRLKQISEVLEVNALAKQMLEAYEEIEDPPPPPVRDPWGYADAGRFFNPPGRGLAGG